MTKPALKLTEADVALACIQFLQAHGWRVHRLTADSYAGHGHKRHEKVQAGTPDYIAVRHFQMLGFYKEVFYLETKRPSGKLRESQTRWLVDAEHRGYIVCVADTFESLKAWYGKNFA